MQKSEEKNPEANSSEWYSFKKSRWGRLYDTLPWDALEACLPEVKRGPAPYFGRRGKFALMFLKHELGVSDEALIEHINTNPCLQRFCHMRLAAGKRIRDTGIVSRVRSYLAYQADLNMVQGVLANHWRATLAFRQVMKVDATCYESYIRYPSDVKLLWECCQWVYAQQPGAGRSFHYAGP
ncbi:MAG: transposase [Bacteroidota bacterium]